MNLAFLTLADPSGSSGQNLYSRSVATALGSLSGVELSLICPEPTDSLPQTLSRAVSSHEYLPSKQPRSLAWHLRIQPSIFFALRTVHRQRALDGLVTTLRPSLFSPPLFVRYHNIPQVLLVEGPLVRNISDFTSLPFAPELTSLIARWNVAASNCVFTADSVSEMWINRNATKGVRVEQFGHGVDTDLFQPRDPQPIRERILSELDVDFIVGFVGSFKPYHCLKPLVKAVDDDRLDRVGLLLVGEGPRRDAVRNLVVERNMEDKVLLPGFVKHERVPEYISACDALYGVIDSTRPESPLKVYEYLACGRPVIVRESDEFKFVESRGLGGVVSKPTVNAIQNSIERLLRAPPEERAKMGQRAADYIDETRTWEALAEKITKCLCPR